MEKELEAAKAEIEKLKCSLDDKDYIIKTQWDEAETLRARVSELQKRRLKAENDVKSPKNNQIEGSDMLEELVERNRKVEDELKWKVEQFKHLEQAYEKVRDQFRASKTEWETEKSSLVDEISKLQEGLDDRNRTSEGLENQLAMCKQALENEGSRRKRLEEEVSEMKSLLENVAHQGFEGKIDGECSAAENGGDCEEEVANLRHSLRVKEMDCKDMEYEVKKLERENQELLTSIRELQEAHIPRAVPTPSSWAKLKSKLKTLEQNQKESCAILKTKEAEWSSKVDRMSQEIKRCNSDLRIKDEIIEELEKELEGYNPTLTQLKQQNEELSLMLQLMRAEGSEKGVAHLMEQLEKEREEKLAMQEELEQLRDEVRDTLDNIDSELTDQANEKGDLEYELQNWISIAAHLEMQVTASQAMRKELELSLLAQAEVEEMLRLDIEVKDRRIGNLEHQIFLMDQEIRIEEEDEKVSQRLQMDDGEQMQLELLARELEDAIVGHMMGEMNYKFDENRQEDRESDHMNGEISFTFDRSWQDDTEPAQKHDRVVQGSDDGKTRIYLAGEEVCASKENARQQHSHIRKTSESNIEERSPFRELN